MFQIENNYTIVRNPDEIVRVTIMIQEGYDKEDVIQRVSQAMENKDFELHNTKISDQMFTANVAYCLVDEIKNIEGVASVKISKQAETTSTPSEENTTQTATEIQPQEENNLVYVYVAGGIFVALVLFIVFRILKKKSA
ncbi:MAG: hypothetical protein ACI4U3_03570 [Traorella sp.]